MQSLTDGHIEAKVVEVDTAEDGHDLKKTLTSLTGSEEFPQIYIDGKFVGGVEALQELIKKGVLDAMRKAKKSEEPMKPVAQKK